MPFTWILTTVIWVPFPVDLNHCALSWWPVVDVMKRLSLRFRYVNNEGVRVGVEREDEMVSPPLSYLQETRRITSQMDNFDIFCLFSSIKWRGGIPPIF